MSNSEWQPDGRPIPSFILDSAVQDKKDGHYRRALEKYIWFFDHAKKYDQTTYTVRISDVLRYWLDLAKKYPPARDAFVRKRDETEAAFHESPSDIRLFIDLDSLNESLDQRHRTADVFEELASNDEEAARRVYRFAESSLVAVGKYQLCNRFLEIEKRIEDASKLHRKSKQREESSATRSISKLNLADSFLQKILGLWSHFSRSMDARRKHGVYRRGGLRFSVGVNLGRC